MYVCAFVCVHAHMNMYVLSDGVLKEMQINKTLYFLKTVSEALLSSQKQNREQVISLSLL